jgi:putative thioredoxin
VLDEKTDSPPALLGLAKVLLAQNQPEKALKTLEEITSSREVNKVSILKPFAEVLLDFKNKNLPNENDQDAIFINSIHLSSQAKYHIALDGLLDILRVDKHYRNKIAQNVVLGILELLGEEDPDTRTYRAELASVLF